jgi:predicted acylesterase/phospholipase RssA
MLLARKKEFATFPEAPTRLEMEAVRFEEMDYVRARRAQNGIAADGDIGLALSGGGIRAACYSLGVLRWLELCGRFHEIDYVSSVSGGRVCG